MDHPAQVKNVYFGLDMSLVVFASAAFFTDRLERLVASAGIAFSVVAQLHGVTAQKVAKTRKRWVQEKSLEDRPRPGRSKRLDGKQEGKKTK